MYIPAALPYFLCGYEHWIVKTREINRSESVLMKQTYLTTIKGCPHYIQLRTKRKEHRDKWINNLDTITDNRQTTAETTRTPKQNKDLGKDGMRM